MAQLLVADFERTVAQYPEQPAVEEYSRKITYRELNIKTNRLAWALKAAGVKQDTIVMAAMPSGINLVASLLAVFKAGGIYLPVDLAFPIRRMTQIFEQTACEVLITTRAQKDAVNALLETLQASVRYLFVLDEDAQIAECLHDAAHDPFDGKICDKNPDELILDTDSCYIFYTSGSTGEAKAFVGVHRSLHHFIGWERKEFNVQPGIRVSQLTQTTFDASLRDIFLPLTSGGTLCIPPVEYRTNMTQLSGWLEDNGVNLVHCVPSLFRLLIKELSAAETSNTRFTELQYVLMAGEILYGRDIQNWQQAVGTHVEIVNLYGTSETTLAKTFHRINELPADPAQAIHAGKPIEGAFIAVISNTGKLCRIGEIGEVYIKTPYMTKGYFKNEALTQKVFVQNPLTPEPDIIYRTGDLGRYLPDRSLEVLGRLDEQVKINGIRVELNEIKQAVLGKDGIREVFVTTHKNREEQQELICYYIGNNITIDDLRAFLQTELPQGLIPSWFIPMEEFPLTLNGKVDKKALPKPDSLIISDEDYEAPQTATETLLDGIFQEVLGLKRVGRKVSFFRVGGTSLKAMQVISRVYKALDISLKVADIFSNPTIAQLATVVAQSGQTTYTVINPLPVQEHYEVSHAQKRLWILDKLEQGQVAYNMPAAVVLNGTLDRDAFARALETLVGRHESLRTVFITVDNEPRQKILPAANCGFKLQYYDLQQESNKESIAAQLVQAEFNTPFDLEAGPLFRTTLLQSGATEYVFAYTIHHIISDGWSMEVLVDEVLSLYNAYVKGEDNPLAPLSIQYKDYAAWQQEQLNGEAANTHKAYWLEKFSGELPVLNLPADHARPALLTSNGDVVKYSLDSSLSQSLKDLGKQQGASLFMVLLAGVKALLYRYTGQNDIITGSPIAGRDHYQLENQIGFYVNTLALRTQFKGNESFVQLLNKVKEVTVGAYDHQLYPFDRLVDDLDLQRDMSRSPLFDVMVALENVELSTTEQRDFGGIVVKDYPADVTISKFDLSFDFYEYGDALQLRIEYNTDLYNRNRIEGMGAHCQQILKSIAGNSETSIDKLSYLTATEQEQLLNTFNATAAANPAGNILELFTQQVQQNPEATAVVFGDTVLSYQELDEASNQLANYLLARYHVQSEERIGIMVNRSEQMLVYVLGVLKAGAAYVPIDPAYPADRLQYMISDSGISVLLTDNQMDERIHGMGIMMVDPALNADEIHIYSTYAPLVNITANQLAYVIYTSGSTGQPKGVMVEHGNLYNMALGWRSAYKLNSFEVHLLQMASMSFDVFFGDVCRALLNGGSMIIAPADLRTDPEGLYKLIAQHRINIFESTPALVLPLMDYIYEQGLDSSFMQLVILGSDTCRVEDFRRLQERFGSHLRILNSYGTTETTIDASYYEATLETTPASGRVPIGKPMRNTQYYILDAQQQLLPVGIPGELYIGGAGVARGYLNRETLTQERFITINNNRLYKTGDLACWQADGNLLFLGRNDHQVKLRGYRIELGEIESALQAHAAITQAVVLLQGNTEDDRQLVAWYTAGEALTAAALRAFLETRLPVYMIPSCFEQLESFPLTVNGKIDYKALQAATLTAAVTNNYVGPRNTLETKLVNIWEEILNRAPIGVLDNFFEIGGHSLKATRVLYQVHKVFHAKMDLRTIFTHPTIAALAEVIAQSNVVAYESITPITHAAHYAISHAQKRLWILDQLEEGQVAYNLPGAFILQGKLDVAAFEQALTTLVARHEILRTTFITVDGEPRQRIHTPEAFKLVKVDMQQAPESQVIECVTAAANHVFNLEQGPLLKADLLQRAADNYVFLLTMHHIIADGWSMEVLVDEVLSLYNAYVKGEDNPLAPLSIQYKDYAAWQQDQLNGEAANTHKAYWLEKFSGELPVLNLPADHARPALLTSNGDVVKYSLDSSLSQSLKDLGKQQGASLFMVLLAGVKALLYRYTGQNDIVTGSPIAGRDHYQLENQIGFYVNTLPLRTQFKGNESFVQLLNKVKEVTVGAYDHQLYPFDRLVDDLDLQRDMSRSPLFDVMVALENVELSTTEQRDFGGIVVKDYPADVTISKFDLSFDFYEYGDALQLRIEYNTDLYNRDRIERMGAHCQQILASIVADSGKALDKLTYLTAEEQQQLLEIFNATAAANPAGNILKLFTQQVQQNPEATAVVFGDTVLNYQDLDEASNQLANYLLARYHVQPEERIGIMVNRSEQMLVYVLGVLKAGAAYVPVDPAYPADRLQYMISDSGISVLLTDNQMDERIHGMGIMMVDPALNADEIHIYSTYAPLVNITANQLAYVIYTSGSTGQPKGVMVEHGNLYNMALGWRSAYKLNSFEVHLLQMASMSFDVFFGDVCRALLNGGSMIIAPADLRTDPEGLYKLIAQYRINIFESTPALVLPLMDHIYEQGLDSSFMQLVILGSDTCRVEDFRRLQERFGSHLRILNSYGTTETTIDASYYEATLETIPASGHVPIGKPMRNTQYYILDAQQQLLPVGISGELYIGGAGVARGYLNRETLTQERFITINNNRLYKTGDLACWQADGNLLFLGRNDHQVKLRGYRIELGEIESALQAHKAIIQAVVLLQGNTEDDRQLVTWYTASEALTAAALRAFLETRLPVYMIPSCFEQLESFPLTVNGKIDYKALQAATLTAAVTNNYVGPRNTLETKLVNIWEEILNRAPIGVLDNFFEIGGHSLKATRVLSQVHKVLQAKIDLRTIFAHPTIESLATAIALSGKTAYQSIVPVPQQAHYALSPAQKRLWIADQLEEDTLAYHMPEAILLEGALNVPALCAAFKALVQQHEILRTRFIIVDGEPRQHVQDITCCEPDLQVTDLRNRPDNEMKAHDLMKQELALPFNLAAGSLLRIRLYQLQDEQHIFLLNMPHIIADGWSMEVLVKEVFERYAAGNAYINKPLPIQYKDYAGWINEQLSGTAIQQHEQYWLQQFSGEVPVLDLLTDHPRPAVKTSNGDTVPFVLDAALTTALSDLALQQEASLYMVLTAVVKAMLHRYTGQQDIVIGTPAAGRDHADLVNQIGLYVNTLALRTQFESDDSFGALLGKVKQTTLGAYDHQLYPFEQLVKATQVSYDRSRSPLTDVWIQYMDSTLQEKQNTAWNGLKITDLKLADKACKFDLAFEYIKAGEQVNVIIRYNTDLFKRATIHEMRNNLLFCLQQVTANEHIVLQEIQLLPSERETTTEDEFMAAIMK